MKIVGAIFGKLTILNFLLCELPLILWVDRKRKNELEIFARGPCDVGEAEEDLENEL